MRGANSSGHDPASFPLFSPLKNNYNDIRNLCIYSTVNIVGCLNRMYVQAYVNVQVFIDIEGSHDIVCWSLLIALSPIHSLYNVMKCCS